MAYNQRSYNYRTNEYLYGSVAPKIENPRREVVHSPKTRAVRVEKVAPGIIISWAIAFVFFAVACVMVLSAQLSKNNYVDAISALETDITEKKADNNLTLARINESVDLDAIQQEAEALGMVKLTPDKIIDVEYTESEYIRQYKNVP